MLITTNKNGLQQASNNSRQSYAMEHTPLPIKAYSYKELHGLMEKLGQPSFRARQLFEWLYAKHACCYDEMTDLPSSLRRQLNEVAPLYCLKLADKQQSRDGTRKYLFSSFDGAVFEAVGIPLNKRLTVCFSTQVGCPLNCSFCATGKTGFTRNLFPGEITDQVSFVAQDMGKRAHNLVAMGQGEPFLNYDNLLAALRIFNHRQAFNIGARQITVSTSGIANGIRRFAKEPEQFRLAVSLHAATQSLRDTLMPGLKSQNLKELHNALLYYTKEKGRRITFEYLLIEGVNDSEEDLAALVAFCKGIPCYINLIPLNETEDNNYKAPCSETVARWVQTIKQNGIEAQKRSSRGADIDGACGQLRNKQRDI